MSNAHSYVQVIETLRRFATGHYMINAFTHGELTDADLDKFTEYPFMHVVPEDITLNKGERVYSLSIYFMDLPRNIADKNDYQKEVISDMIRLAEDLVSEIDNGHVLFGSEVYINEGARIEPFMQETKHVLSGCSLTLQIVTPFDWNACDIPADYAVGGGSSSGGSGGSGLTFAKSIVNTDGVVTLVNDSDAPGNSKVYGTNSSGVKGWYTQSGGGGSNTWGDITGDITDQTDLIALLNAQDTALDNEITARQSADTTLQTNINSEASTRASADTTLQNNITAEASARSAADSTIAAAAAAAQADIDAHEANTSNPHSVTKSQVGLGNVDNTSDANKPVSTAQQTAINAKVTANAAITAATKTKITYDSKGLVTGGSDLAASDIPSGIDAAKIGDGSVSNTEFQRLDGVTSPIQTQIDAKMASASILKGRITSDLSAFTSTTVANATGLSFSVVNGNTYKFCFYVLFTSAASTTGAKFAVTFPAGNCSVTAAVPRAQSASSGMWTGHTPTSGTAITADATPTASPDIYMAKIEGVLHCTADGTVQLQVGTEVNTSAITVKAGSLYIADVLP